VIGESDDRAIEEARAILADLAREDPEFEGSARQTFGRRPYEIPADHELVRALAGVVRGQGREAAIGGMSFWTDAAILGHAGIPSLLFGPGGAGLHSTEEHVRIDDVFACRDALAALAKAFC